MNSKVGETVLVTGAAGRLGRIVRAPLLDAGWRLRLADRRGVGSLRANETFVRARLGDARAMRRVCRDASAILHLGGVATEQSWKALIKGNVDGLVTLLEAARAEGVRRFVFASSMHVLGLYGRDEVLTEVSDPRPDTRYASTKIFGEGVCRQFAEKYGMAVTIIRIGHVAPQIAAAPFGQSISERDLIRLFALSLGLDAPGVHLFHGVAPQAGDVTSDGRLEAEYGFRFEDPGLEAAAATAAAQRATPLGDRGKTCRGGTFADLP